MCGEFLNAELLAYCERQQLTFTRGRAYKKNHQCYPGQFPDVQLRTLQRRVQTWRAQAILAFDDHWLQEEVLVGQVVAPSLRAIAETEVAWTDPIAVEQRASVQAPAGTVGPLGNL